MLLPSLPFIMIYHDHMWYGPVRAYLSLLKRTSARRAKFSPLSICKERRDISNSGRNCPFVRVAVSLPALSTGKHVTLPRWMFQTFFFCLYGEKIWTWFLRELINLLTFTIGELREIRRKLGELILIKFCILCYLISEREKERISKKKIHLTTSIITYVAKNSNLFCVHDN